MELKSMSTLKNSHPNERCVILGCGPSVVNFKDYLGRCFTIGVNDIGEFTTPDILVVLDEPRVFTKDRLKTIQNTPVKIFASQIKDFPVNKDIVEQYVTLRLGNRVSDDLLKNLKQDMLNISTTSTYVAAILAFYMGFSKIGLIGVDFTTNHYNRQDGVHRLNHRLKETNIGYRALEKIFSDCGVQFVNLSQESNIEVTKMSLEEFFKN